MISFDKAKSNPILLFSIIACVAFLCAIYIYSVPLNSPQIRSDGHGYYMYLPAFFIYNDPYMRFIKWIDDVGSFATTYFESPLGAMVDKYTMGTAVLQLPFFLAAHFLTLLINPSEATGFSYYYEWFNVLSACVYYVVGAYFSYKVARKYATEFNSKLAVLLCTIGSNLFHYISYDASFSHVYSFALISIFLYIISEKDVHDELDYKWYALLGIIYGLIVLVRITDATVILLYILWNAMSIDVFRERIKHIRLSNSGVMFLSAVITFCPQIFYWYITTGQLFLNSYAKTDTGFTYWNNPQILSVLFLFEKGIFFWCPIVLIAVVGGIFYRNRLRNAFFASGIFFLVYVYVISSWWCYTFGGGFSHRMFVNIMPLFIIFLSVTLDCNNNNKIIKMSLLLIMQIAIAWNILSMLAYWHRIIPYDGYTLTDVFNILKWAFLSKYSSYLFVVFAAVLVANSFRLIKDNNDE